MNDIDYLADPRFRGIRPFASRVWLSSPTMHGEEQQYVNEALSTNWVSTVGDNICEAERMTADKIGCRCAVAVSSGTAALHLAVRLFGEKLYGRPKLGRGALDGHQVFCSDMTFAATANPIVYEGGEPVFIDAEYDTWNMDPAALENAFAAYPEVRLVIMAHLYGVPGKLSAIRSICDRHGAFLIEDAAESFGAAYQGIQTGRFGDAAVLSFNGNKIVTGSTGGMLLTDSAADAEWVRKRANQSREPTAWYQHETPGYNYRMSNLVAGVVRGQLPHLEEHIAGKREIYLRYREGLRGLPVSMNPFDAACSAPNYWLSCLLIDPDALCPQMRNEREAFYLPTPGKSCPTELLAVLAAFQAEGRPLWKPMHLQPLYRTSPFVTAADTGAALPDTGADLFRRGICLPSDNKMTPEQQAVIIRLIRNCFA